jgi:hypothetical protein
LYDRFFRTESPGFVAVDGVPEYRTDAASDPLTPPTLHCVVPVSTPHSAYPTADPQCVVFVFPDVNLFNPELLAEGGVGTINRFAVDAVAVDPRRVVRL